MDIEEQTWPQIQRMADVEGRSAPKAVVVALTSVLRDADTASAWASMDVAPSTTTWTCWVVTEKSVGHVRRHVRQVPI